MLALARTMLVAGTPSLSLVPLLGAFEYSADACAPLRYDHTQESWILRAETPLKPGEGVRYAIATRLFDVKLFQIADSYGSADNLHLLLYHSFASVR